MRKSFKFLEYGIFIVVTLLFLNSLLHLLKNNGSKINADTWQPEKDRQKHVVSNPRLKLNGTSAVYELACQNEHLETVAEQLRLIGKACPTKGRTISSIKNLKVENRTIGFYATVFQNHGIKTTDFLTDFIPLAPGKNDIVIHMEATGKNPIELYVFRKETKTEK